MLALPKCGQQPGATRQPRSRQFAATLRRQTSSNARLKSPCASSGDAELREQVKRLTKLFYTQASDQDQGREGPAGSTTSTATSEAAAGSSPAAIASTSYCIEPDSGDVSNLPLWRVQFAVLPGMQQILHVHVPHYVHMFESVFNQPQPWHFGAVLLPDGSANLGNPEYDLRPGTKAPLVGVLMEVSRAVRLLDGKLLLLATGICRMKV